MTLFGVVDAGITYINSKDTITTTAPGFSTSASGSSSLWALTSGNETASRLGFRGTEDLGGGLAASFWLEAGLGVDTGAAGANTFFNRRSTVSLSGNFGELRLGRDYSPTFWSNSNFDPFGVNGVGTNLIQTGFSSIIRNSNSIGYLLPANLGGFYGQIQYAFDEQPHTSGDPSVSTGRYVGGRFGYANGPLDVAVAYGQHTLGINPDNGTPFWGPGTPLAGLPYAGDNVAGVSKETLSIWNLGASYDFGVVKLYGEYSDAKDKVDTFGVGSNSVNQYGYLLGVTVPVGPGLIKASYSHIQNKVDGPDPKADKFALGYVYNMSKRTALYATFAYTKSKDYSGMYYLNNNLYGTTDSGKTYGYDFGLRHSF